jgi:ferric-dicitrate binding protein FerR (iron transport regulator)
MNEKRPELEDPNQDALGALVRAAGPRALPPAEQVARARVRVHDEWRASLSTQRRVRIGWLAAAAVALFAVGVGFYLWPRPEVGVQVAVADRVSGAVQLLNGKTDRETSLHVNAALHDGDSVATGADGRVLLSWLNGGEVRVDRDSIVEIDSGAALRLLEGTLYVDTRTSNESATPLAILTSVGVVRHVGTRFEVRVADGGTRVRVRDGTALFTGTDHAVVLIGSGQQLSVAEGRSALVDGPGPADAVWEWTSTISPQFDIEGRSLYDSVEWLAHEAGLKIVYANSAVRARAQLILVHGNVEGMPTRDALVAVLTGSGFDFAMEPEQVRIGTAQAH